MAYTQNRLKATETDITAGHQKDFFELGNLSKPSARYCDNSLHSQAHQRFTMGYGSDL